MKKFFLILFLIPIACSPKLSDIDKYSEGAKKGKLDSIKKTCKTSKTSR